MQEEKEKKQAQELARALDAPGVAEPRDEEAAVALDTAMAVKGVFGNVPDIKPEFDQMLRARLVREARKRKSVSSTQNKKWMQLAVAAVLMIVLVPTVMMMRDKIDPDVKLNQLEKYDKMYVPYSEMLKRGEVEAYRPQPFSQGHRERVRRMSTENIARQRASSYLNYQLERR